MSTENEQELATQTANAETNKVDYAAEIERLKTANERLLFESQKNKTRKDELDSMKAQLDEIESKKLEDAGNWQERLKLEQEKTASLNMKLEDQSNKILKSNVYNAVQKAAKDAYDVDDLLAQSEYAKMIEVNEDTLMPNSESIASFVNAVKENKSHLFRGKKVASMADSKPVIDRPLTKTIQQMTADERKKAMGEAIANSFQTKG